MSRIVAILASPRAKGNSATIAEAVLDGAMGLSTNFVEIYRIHNMISLRPCDHCDKCKETGNCVIRDDLTKAIDAVRDSDSLVLAVPLYFGQASAQYRLFEDRLYCFIGRDGRSSLPKGKKLVVIVTFDGSEREAEDLAGSIAARYRDIFGFEIVGKIVYRCSGRADAASGDREVLRSAEKLGNRL
jgi:multimeric flavodoxin WrbA